MARLSKDDKRFLASALDWAIANEEELITAYGYEPDEELEPDDQNREVIESTQANITRIRKLQIVLRSQATQT